MSEETKTMVIRGASGVVLTSMEEAWRFALAIEKSGLGPKGMQASAIFAVQQAGAEFGLSPMASLTNFKVINGRTGPMVRCALAKVLASGEVQGKIKDELIGAAFEDDYCCRVTSTRKGHPTPTITEYSVADAKRAGLWGKKGRGGEPTPWVTYPKEMLYARAMGRHLEKQYPDIMVGFVTAESLQDYPDEREVRGVTLTPQADIPKDPILDLLPQGKTTEDLQEVLEIVEADRSTGNRMTAEVQSDILKRLEANDAALSMPDTANASIDGAEQGDLGLKGIV